jgi:hypothetical protein
MQKPAKTCKNAQTLQNERLKWEYVGISGNKWEIPDASCGVGEVPERDSIKKILNLG